MGVWPSDWNIQLLTMLSRVGKSLWSESHICQSDGFLIISTRDVLIPAYDCFGKCVKNIQRFNLILWIKLGKRNYLKSVDGFGRGLQRPSLIQKWIIHTQPENLTMVCSAYLQYKQQAVTVGWAGVCNRGLASYPYRWVCLFDWVTCR